MFDDYLFFSQVSEETNLVIPTLFGAIRVGDVLVVRVVEYDRW